MYGNKKILPIKKKIIYFLSRLRMIDLKHSQN